MWFFGYVLSCCAKPLSGVWLWWPLGTSARQAALSVGFFQVRTLEWVAISSSSCTQLVLNHAVPFPHSRFFIMSECPCLGGKHTGVSPPLLFCLYHASLNPYILSRNFRSQKELETVWDIPREPSLVVQSLRLCASTAGGKSSISGLGTRSHMLCDTAKAKGKKTLCYSKVRCRINHDGFNSLLFS